ncbi:hypothetical protein [Myxococcus sp. CA040A]|uniref:hypothetical protein n=1 Tax=Myxococcus sp. CA040A TaxID=2741738 RepID=UPI00157B3F6B|nr:hypothetical protein [Myxococcus sp. CA040A]NTX07573.1 hypothetical protein [Myxococcus sp. CA040A]
MSTPPPLPVHDLENPPEAPFWTRGDASSRRVFIVPVSPPSSFVAFGALWPADLVEVLFIAQGKVEEHLGAFVERMAREDARVELCVWPPLPKEFVAQYATVPPYEGHEYEPPPGTPVRGAAADARVDPYSRLRGEPLWAGGDASSRYTYLAPLSDSSQFLALGVTRPSDEVVFAAKGSLVEDLGALIAHALSEQSFVELHARPPLPSEVLGRYLGPPPQVNTTR